MAIAQETLGVGPDTGFHARQVLAGARLTKADTKERLAPTNARQVELLLRLGAVLQDQRAALAIGDPMRAHGRAKVEKSLHQHIARKRAAASAAICARQGDAKPAALAQRAAERGVMPAPGARA